jgi:transposase InsO family protein
MSRIKGLQKAFFVGRRRYIRTWAGMTYAAFVMDAYSRMILGCQTSTSLRADLALDAQEMTLWRREKENLDGLVHQSAAFNTSPSATPNAWPKPAPSPRSAPVGIRMTPWLNPSSASTRPNS